MEGKFLTARAARLLADPDGRQFLYWVGWIDRQIRDAADLGNLSVSLNLRQGETLTKVLTHYTNMGFTMEVPESEDTYINIVFDWAPGSLT